MTTNEAVKKKKQPDAKQITFKTLNPKQIQYVQLFFFHTGL